MNHLLGQYFWEEQISISNAQIIRNAPPHQGYVGGAGNLNQKGIKFKSAVYRLTSERRIVFFKPEGKKIFFKREDLESWMLSNPISTKVEGGLNCFKRK